MAIPLPKKTKDLPTLEPDSEDELDEQDENFSTKLERLSQLPPLDSDSESSETVRPASLECNNGLDDIKEDLKLATELKQDNIDGTLNVDGLRIINWSQEEEESAKRRLLLPVFPEKEPESCLKHSGLKKSSHSLPEYDVSSNKNTLNLKTSKEKQLDTEVFIKKIESSNKELGSLYLDPLPRKTISPINPCDISELAPSNLRPINENEFSSRKILFTTPATLPRKMAPKLSDYSINLSMEEFAPKKEVKKEVYRNLETNYYSNGKNSDKEIVINGRRFSILDKLGSGGSSTVFATKESVSNKEWALKIVDLQGDRSIVEGYINEVKLLAKLQGNQSVVTLYQYEHLEKESKLYMVMEKGESDLHKILRTYQGNLPLYTLTTYWYQMLNSVNYIHQNGVIHSDLKPANFLMVNGRLKLIDFGIASNISVDSTSIIKFSQAGTFNYISPEALTDISTCHSPAPRGQPKIKISTKSDVWSLGCILYLLLYKKTPFGHIKNIGAKVSAIASPSTKIEYPELPIYYPQMLIEMATKCLQHNPKKRSSVSDLLQYPFQMLIPINKT